MISDQGTVLLHAVVAEIDQYPALYPKTGTHTAVPCDTEYRHVLGGIHKGGFLALSGDVDLVGKTLLRPDDFRSRNNSIRSAQGG